MSFRKGEVKVLFIIFEIIIPLLTLFLIGYFLYDTSHPLGYEDLDKDLAEKALLTFPESVHLQEKKAIFTEEQLNGLD